MTSQFTLQLLLAFMALGYGLAQVRMPGQEKDYFGKLLTAAEGRANGQQIRPTRKATVLHARVTDLPQHGRTTLKVTATVLAAQNGTGEMQKTSGMLMLMLKNTPKAASVQPGDHLLLCCSPSPPSMATNPGQFNYRRYLSCRGVLYQAFVDDTEYVVLCHDAKGWRTMVAHWRGTMLKRMRQSRLTAAQQGVAEALLLGWKDDVDEETQAQFRDAGITHLLCVSGLHVGIVAWLIGWCLKPFCVRRRGYMWISVVQLAGTWAFVILTGMAPSTCRAGIMFSCIIVGELFFSKPPVLNSVAVSALILLLARPLVLFDVGFQLSYAAVIGIVTLAPTLQKMAQGAQFQDHLAPWFFAKVWNLLCVTTAAQLSTLPLVLYYFHQFPLYFVVANITIVPFATVLLATALVMMLISWWTWAFHAAGWLLGVELKGVAAVTGWVSSLPHAMLQSIYFDLPMALLMGVAVLMVILWTQGRTRALLLELPQGRRNQRILPLLSLAALLAMSCYVAIRSLSFGHQHLLVCYDTGSRTALEMVQGHSGVLYCDSATAAQPSRVDFQVQGCEVCHQVHQRKVASLPRFLSLGATRIAIVVHSNSYELRHIVRHQRNLPPRLRVQYVVLADYAYVSVPELTQLFDFDTIVLASSLSRSSRQTRIEECQQLGIPCHDVSQEGAWVMKAHNR